MDFISVYSDEPNHLVKWKVTEPAPYVIEIERELKDPHHYEKYTYDGTEISGPTLTVKYSNNSSSGEVIIPAAAFFELPVVCQLIQQASMGRTFDTVSIFAQNPIAVLFGDSK